MTADTRKTLEACAKMMGLQFNPTVKLKSGLHIVHPEADCQSHTYYWNPLTSVADAAELAIKLKIDVQWDEKNQNLFANKFEHSVGAVVFFKDHPSEQLAYCYAVCKVAEQLSERGM